MLYICSQVDVVNNAMFSLLSKFTVIVHKIVPSEASVARSFSNQGQVHTDLRSSLDHTVVRSIMMVRMHLVNVFDVPGLPKEKRRRVD